MLYKLESKITNVTVFLSGAQITRCAHYECDSGTSEIVLENLPQTLRPDSIQASAEGGAVILSMEHKINHLKGADKSESIKELQQELESLNDELGEQKLALELCGLEENFFAANNSLAGSETGLKTAELKEAVAFYCERMADIKKNRNVCDKKIKKLKEKIQALEAQLGSYRSLGQVPVSEITLKVSTKEPSSGDIVFSYYVPSASWQPYYDIRVKDTQSPVLLAFKAKVSQNTGENWENIKLALSTGNPNINGECPELKPWYINFYSPPSAKNQYQSFNLAPPMASMDKSSKIGIGARLRSALLDEESIDEDIFMDSQEQNTAEFEPPLPLTAAAVSESLTAAEYTINEPYDIPSGDGGQNVEIISHSLSAKYRYFSVRKLEKEVFLLAAVSGWEHANIIAGEASVFFEGRYVGKTYIDPRRAEEEFELSLGVDNSVTVTRVNGKDFTGKNVMGNSVKQMRSWELTARNLKSVPVDIKLVDQLPVSQNKQITVDPVELSGAALDEETGILTWTFSLEPAQSKKMTVKYAVTRPKNTIVYLD